MYIYTSNNNKNNNKMKASQSIANQINSHIEDLKENNEWYDKYDLVKDYFFQFSLPVNSSLFEETLKLIK